MNAIRPPRARTNRDASGARHRRVHRPALHRGLSHAQAAARQLDRLEQAKPSAPGAEAHAQLRFDAARQRSPDSKWLLIFDRISSRFRIGSTNKKSRGDDAVMKANDSYLVRITSVANAAGLFTWELCRGDRLEVIHRSTKAFPTRTEALFDSAQSAAVSTLLAIQNLPLC